MKDSADDESDVGETEEAEGTWIKGGHEPVPPDAEWEQVVQKPVDEQPRGGLTSTIVYAVAEAEGVSPTEIRRPQLFEVADTAALEAAFFGAEEIVGSHNAECTTEFMYRDHRVVVRSDGWVLVYDRVDEE